MATYVGFQTAGILGGIIATLGLILPSLIIVVRISKFLRKFGNNPILCEVMLSIRPVVMALILMAGIDLMKISVLNYVSAIFAVLFFTLVYFYKKGPVFIAAHTNIPILPVYITRRPKLFQKIDKSLASFILSFIKIFMEKLTYVFTRKQNKKNNNSKVNS